MLIDDKKWNDIIAETKVRIDRWTARATERGLKDTFRFTIQKTDRYEVILTEHLDGCNLDAKGLARELATGEIRSTNVIRKKGRSTGFETKTPDPKGWKGLADKPADEIVTKLKLTDFFVIIGVIIKEADL
jgi:hypothetical protein